MHGTISPNILYTIEGNNMVIDLILISLYVVAVVCAIYIIGAHRKYFKERFKAGVVSAFMLAMLFFLGAYTFKMLTVLWIRASKLLGAETVLMQTLQLYAWTIAQIGTTLGLVILAVLTYTKRFDLFIYLRKVDRKGENGNVLK
ncbi:hypothetical protein [Paenibacillus sp. SN-8-1]|uniref:hypothetical protein n=1 Tax=Paenibacillus sp. SN-8-1 TaxID=3435409 RepID=UPI003D9A1A84